MQLMSTAKMQKAVISLDIFTLNTLGYWRTSFPIHLYEYAQSMETDLRCTLTQNRTVAALPSLAPVFCDRSIRFQFSD